MTALPPDDNTEGMISAMGSASIMVSQGDKVLLMNGSSGAAFVFEEGEKEGKLSGLVLGEISETGLYKMLEAIAKQVGMEKFAGASSRLALQLMLILAREGEAAK